MGAVLEPTESMIPWYGVEVRSESAYVTATRYANGALRQRTDKGDMTDDERASAWNLVDEATTIAPGTPAALAAALAQIVEHDAYRTWSQSHGDVGNAGAQLRDGRLLVTAPNSHRYGERKGAKETGNIEFAYQDVGPILADLRRIGVE